MGGDGVSKNYMIGNEQDKDEEGEEEEEDEGEDGEDEEVTLEKLLANRRAVVVGDGAASKRVDLKDCEMSGKETNEVSGSGDFEGQHKDSHESEGEESCGWGDFKGKYKEGQGHGNERGEKLALRSNGKREAGLLKRKILEAKRDSEVENATVGSVTALKKRKVSSQEVQSEVDGEMADKERAVEGKKAKKQAVLALDDAGGQKTAFTKMKENNEALPCCGPNGLDDSQSKRGRRARPAVIGESITTAAVRGEGGGGGGGGRGGKGGGAVVCNATGSKTNIGARSTRAKKEGARENVIDDQGDGFLRKEESREVHAKGDDREQQESGSTSRRSAMMMRSSSSQSTGDIASNSLLRKTKKSKPVSSSLGSKSDARAGRENDDERRVDKSLSSTSGKQKESGRRVKRTLSSPSGKEKEDDRRGVKGLFFMPEVEEEVEEEERQKRKGVKVKALRSTSVGSGDNGRTNSAGAKQMEVAKKKGSKSKDGGGGGGENVDRGIVEKVERRVRDGDRRKGAGLGSGGGVVRGGGEGENVAGEGAETPERGGGRDGARRKGVLGEGGRIAEGRFLRCARPCSSESADRKSPIQRKRHRRIIDDDVDGDEDREDLGPIFPVVATKKRSKIRRASDDPFSLDGLLREKQAAVKAKERAALAEPLDDYLDSPPPSATAEQVRSLCDQLNNAEAGGDDTDNRNWGEPAFGPQKKGLCPFTIDGIPRQPDSIVGQLIHGVEDEGEQLLLAAELLCGTLLPSLIYGKGHCDAATMKWLFDQMVYAEDERFSGGAGNILCDIVSTQSVSSRLRADPQDSDGGCASGWMACLTRRPNGGIEIPNTRQKRCSLAGLPTHSQILGVLKEYGYLAGNDQRKTKAGESSLTRETTVGEQGPPRNIEFLLEFIASLCSSREHYKPFQPKEVEKLVSTMAHFIADQSLAWIRDKVLHCMKALLAYFTEEEFKSRLNVLAASVASACKEVTSNIHVVSHLPFESMRGKILLRQAAYSLLLSMPLGKDLTTISRPHGVPLFDVVKAKTKRGVSALDLIDLVEAGDIWLRNTESIVSSTQALEGWASFLQQCHVQVPVSNTQPGASTLRDLTAFRKAKYQYELQELKRKDDRENGGEEEEWVQQ
ncbi:hypothetical protein CBR_g12009 [Chara braunii]|uniref:Coiled-coil SMC6 And NSE5 INteracting (CANIN) domain-containing protein n=1 Tax=Chara braunii TaxID=69332 RepID=A0A388KQT4_CHABU|nr:hypothetical protein CBR_g12009 [Chara braunii]|eukprot:GBG72430.1 hypothetical protein CBR_g12009 [Chara braunii]